MLQIKEMFVYITGLNGYARMFNPKLFLLRIHFLPCNQNSRPKMEEKEMLQEEDVLEKPKGHGAPEPLPVKEFLEGAGKNTFIRPMGCVHTV